MRILGHRGARHEAPENTLAGIEHGLAAGVDGVEVDVRITSDGRIVVIHDATVDRTTNGSGPVAGMTFDELRTLDAGDGERVPLLEEVVAALRGRGVLSVEIKERAHALPVARRLHELDATGFVNIISFDHRPLAVAAEAAPGLRTGCLVVARPADPVGLVMAAGADFLSIHLAYVDAELVATCHAAQVPVCAWNCNEPGDLPRYAEIGVDWLGTDEPSRVVPATRG
jgi:glycerophosphoryl diester phosphodiesterase